MLICSNVVVSVLHNIMRSIIKNVHHETKRKIVHIFEPWWAKLKKEAKAKWVKMLYCRPSGNF